MKKYSEKRPMSAYTKPSYGKYGSKTLCESESSVLQYTKYKDRHLGMWRPHPKKDNGNMCFQTPSAEILAARSSKNWKDFVQSQSTNQHFGFRDDKEKSKRVRRYLMLANAIDALEDMPGDEHIGGGKFMGNSWGMGPFYSYNNNYLR